MVATSVSNAADSDAAFSVSGRRVMKFGGAALRDGPGIEHCARLVASRSEARPLVVVSAHAGVTRLLERAVQDAGRGTFDWERLRVRHKTLLRQLRLGGELVDRLLRELRGILYEMARARRVDRRLRDAVLSYGERISARIVAEVLRQRGIDATPLDAFDVGLVARDSDSGRPVLDPPSPEVRRALGGIPGIPVVTGFVAVDCGGDLTTLGPNGSDLSAVWFGEAVGASEVELWKDVPGFMTADPRYVPAARSLEALGRSEAVELAIHGAEVLHPGALEPARRSDVAVRIKSLADPEATGTRIQRDSTHEGPAGLAHHAALSLWVEPIGLGRDLNAVLIQRTSMLREAGLQPYRVSASATWLNVLLLDGPRTRVLLERMLDDAPEARLRHGLSSLAIVGAGVGDDPHCADLVREEARRLGIGVSRAPGGAGASSQVFLCPAPCNEELLRAVHARLFG